MHNRIIAEEIFRNSLKITTVLTPQIIIRADKRCVHYSTSCTLNTPTARATQMSCTNMILTVDNRMKLLRVGIPAWSTCISSVQLTKRMIAWMVQKEWRRKTNTAHSTTLLCHPQLLKCVIVYMCEAESWNSVSERIRETICRMPHTHRKAKRTFWMLIFTTISCKCHAPVKNEVGKSFTTGRIVAVNNSISRSLQLLHVIYCYEFEGA